MGHQKNQHHTPTRSCLILIWMHTVLEEKNQGVVVVAVFQAPRGTWFPASSKPHLSAEESCATSADPQITAFGNVTKRVLRTQNTGSARIV